LTRKENKYQVFEGVSDSNIDVLKEFVLIFHTALVIVGCDGLSSDIPGLENILRNGKADVFYVDTSTGTTIIHEHAWNLRPNFFCRFLNFSLLYHGM